FHTHDTAILYVPISVSPTDTQILGQEWLGVKPTDRSRFEGLVVASDTSYAQKPLTHRVKNVGDRLFRLIAITNGSGGSVRQNGAPPGTMVHSSPWYAAAKLPVTSHGTPEWHLSPMPTVVLLPGAGRVQIERESAAGPAELDQPGAWSFIPAGVRYRIRNLNEADADVVVVQANR
ncbi:MAG TPA: hypothetical protein VJU15_15330, partial [Gemmatimonadales bacterium]|nr:hypothetical protein [Gemmatimonadales bacterium]